MNRTAHSAKVKQCVGCGADVSHQPRTKDENGSYYCDGCWNTHDNDTSTDLASLAELNELLACPICGGSCAVTLMDESGVCKQCATKGVPKNAPRFRLQPSFRKEPFIIVGIISVALIIGGSVIGRIVWTNSKEQKALTHLNELKASADRALAADDPATAASLYGDALAYAKSKSIETTASGLLAQANRQKSVAEKQVAAQELAAQAEQKRQQEVAAKHDEERRLPEQQKRDAATIELQQKLIAQRRFIYTFAADAPRLMELLPDGKFGVGPGGGKIGGGPDSFEQSWIATDGGIIINGSHGKYSLLSGPDGVMRGRIADLGFEVTLRPESSNDEAGTSKVAGDPINPEIEAAVRDLASSIDNFYLTSASIDALTAQCEAAQARGDLNSSAALIEKLQGLDSQMKGWEKRSFDALVKLGAMDRAQVVAAMDKFVRSNPSMSPRTKQRLNEMRADFSNEDHSQHSSRQTPNNDDLSGSSRDTSPAPRQSVRVVCPDCGGTGMLSDEEQRRLISAAAGAVAGTGGSMRLDMHCRTCHGKGYVVR